MKKNKVVKLFGNDDPRINALVQDIKNLVYKRSVGVFQVATVMGILHMVQHEILNEMEGDYDI